MSELTTVTVSRKGQALLPLKWRKSFGLESGGPCDARELNDGKGSLLLTPRPKARRGTKGLLAHLREQTVSLPPVRRHHLPSNELSAGYGHHFRVPQKIPPAETGRVAGQK